MATGRDNQLTQHRGEYLVAAELCRRGYLATTFTGNVPDLDIVAINDKLEAKPIQVKATRIGSWPFMASKFMEIDLNEKRGVQSIVRKRRVRYPELKYVLVDLTKESSPQFFIIDERILRDIIHGYYKAFLNKHQGRRPQNPESMRVSVTRSMLKPYLDNWDFIFG